MSVSQAHRSAYEQFYLVLAAVFVAALVACNLIFQKFFIWDLSFLQSGLQFQQSVGILAYPLTFLVTDILSEIYGKERAERVVTSGLVASLFILLLVLLATLVKATPWSPVDDIVFQKVFGLQWIAVSASMLAYLGAQYLDIRVFHFWKRLTNGRHLWLRNNASTFTSQVVDTMLVNGLLVVFGNTGVTWDRFPELFLNGVAFKWIVALLDTPVLYVVVYFLRRRFNISELNNN